MSNIEHLNEEFNNFMYRVNEVSSIVKKLSSQDKTLNRIGTLEADRFLRNNGKSIGEDVSVDDVKVTVKNNRSVINHEAFKEEENPSTMSQERFMKEVSRDAEQRYQDRLVRKEKCETMKTQATKAFRRGEYEKALNCYNKAIGYIRDSAILYINRGLTYINLKLYDEAIKDCETALELNENSLKAWLLLAKAHILTENMTSFHKCVQEAKDRNKEKTEFIEEYVQELQNERDAKRKALIEECKRRCEEDKEDEEGKKSNE